MLTISPVPYEPIDMPLLHQHKVHLTIKRLDLIHPLVSGNKWYKLKYNLREIKDQGYGQLLTFGGAYSNHIHATAIAARLLEVPAVGVIRGEGALPLNPTLKAASAAGMKLHYIPRSAYREKGSKELIRQLEDTFGKFYLLPEGGTNALAIQGTEEILQDGASLRRSSPRTRLTARSARTRSEIKSRDHSPTANRSRPRVKIGLFPRENHHD